MARWDQRESGANYKWGSVRQRDTILWFMEKITTSMRVALDGRRRIHQGELTRGSASDLHPSVVVPTSIWETLRYVVIVLARRMNLKVKVFKHYHQRENTTVLFSPKKREWPVVAD